MTDLPDPPVPASADMTNFPFTPIYRARLFGSKFHARANDSEWRAGVTLWLKSQDQVPAGSLPDDDTDLCRLAELARDIKTWRKIRSGALHGWYKCNDGRLYNNTVATVVNDQLDGKALQQLRTLKARIAGLEKRLSQPSSADVTVDIQRQLQALRQELSQSQKGPVTEPVTASNRRDRDRERDTLRTVPGRFGEETVEEVGDGAGVTPLRGAR